MTLYHCDKCHERSEVWKRTAMGKHFSYCINKSCPTNRKEHTTPTEKKVLDKSDSSGIIGIITPETNMPDKSGTNQMTYRDAEILIAEARNLGYRGTDWEQQFLARIELMRPAFLLPEDATSVEEFYRRASGGSYRTNKRSLARIPNTEGF